MDSNKPYFQQPSNRQSSLVANGWIEQYRKSKMWYAWKEVSASLVQGQNPGEETTLWIQKEVINPTTMESELKPLHQIPLKMVESISLKEETTDNQFALKVYNSPEEFVFRCAEAPVDCLRWVQMLKKFHAVVKERDSKEKNEKKEAPAPPDLLDVDEALHPQHPSSGSAASSHCGMAIRDLRAICHGAGINTAGMERNQLEKAALEIQSRGTYFNQNGSAPHPSFPMHQQHAHASAPSSAPLHFSHAFSTATETQLSIHELRAVCHGAGINTAGMERRELEAAAEAVQKRGTFFDPPPLGMQTPSVDHWRQQEARRQEEAQVALERQRLQEDARKQAAAAEERRREEETRRRVLEQEAQRKAEEARRRALAAERQRELEEEARRRALLAEQEKQRKLVEEARRRALLAEQERQRRIDEEVKKRAAEEEARRRAAAAVAEQQRWQQAEEERQRAARTQQQQFQQQQDAWQRKQQEDLRRREADKWAQMPSSFTAQQQQQQQQHQYQSQQQWNRSTPQQQGNNQHQFGNQHSSNQNHSNAPPPSHNQHQHSQQNSSPASKKYAAMANQTTGDGQATMTRLKHGILLQWALQPPHMQMLRPIDVLITTIHTVFPPALGVSGHSYFQKWKSLQRADVVGPSGLPDDDKLKKSVRKIRFFLHPDKLPHDLTEEQKFMTKMLWDITSDAWDEHLKRKG